MTERASTSAVLARTRALVDASVEMSRQVLPFVQQAFEQLKADIREEVSKGKPKGIDLLSNPM